MKYYTLEATVNNCKDNPEGIFLRLDEAQDSFSQAMKDYGFLKDIDHAFYYNPAGYYLSSNEKDSLKLIEHELPRFAKSDGINKILHLGDVIEMLISKYQEIGNVPFLVETSTAFREYDGMLKVLELSPNPNRFSNDWGDYDDENLQTTLVLVTE